MIRLARPSDLPALAEIERSAGEIFREFGMDAVADDEPFSAEELTPFISDGRAWVATDGSDLPIAYILVREIDDGAHIEQVSVHDDYARRRIGASLIETVAGWARQRRRRSITLTTFAEVPWNAPYYRTIGFAEVPVADVTPGLREICKEEEARGLTSWPRVVMRRQLRDP